MRMPTFYQPKTLRSALFPTTFMYWMVGMGVIEYPFGHPRRIFGLLYSSTICALYGIASIHSYDVVVQGGQPLGSSIGSFGYRIATWLNYSLTFTVIIVSIWLNKKRRNFITELMDIDAALTKMGAACSYQAFFMWQTLHLLIFILALIIINIMDLINLMQFYRFFGSLKMNTAWYSHMFTVFLLTVADIAFSSFIRMVTQYFKDINSLLKSMKINVSDDNNPRMQGNLIQVEAISSDKQTLQKLRCIRTVHSRLARVATRWTELNRVPIIANIVTCLCSLTILTPSVYDMFSNSNPMPNKMALVSTLLGIIFWIGKLFHIVHSAAALMSEAKRTCGILLRHLYSIAFIRFEVHAFALHLTQNPLRLSAGGLCDLDYSLVQMVITTVCTYLVVLIQTRNT